MLGVTRLAKGEAEGTGIGRVDIDQPCIDEPLGSLPVGLQPLLLLEGVTVVGACPRSV